MDLEVVRRLYVLTANGQREVQLCAGDITRIPPGEHVDVICISALPNNYRKTPGSVVCALYKTFGLDVEDLAANHKQEDIRKTCHCWISKPLPDHLPYRQLICFEQAYGRGAAGGEKLTNAVDALFRAMMPVFNNENKSVITPLLCTRVQHVQHTTMLIYMVTSAIRWMYMGLPLQCLKIVVYAKDLNSPLVVECVKVFENLRNKVDDLKFTMKGPSLRWDIFFVYATEDENVHKQVLQHLKSCESITTNTLYCVETDSDSWQYDLNMAMSQSKRVVPLLTEAFMTSSECLDAYNVALCVNRQCRRPLLAPLLIDPCQLPQYMTMVQWIKCTPRDLLKIERAASHLISESQPRENPNSYDVFLSYSHRNLDEAKVVLKELQSVDPEMKIFFDYEEITTGLSWQEKLYDSVSESVVIVAMVSPDYLSSAMCQEEFRLAMAQFVSKKKLVEIIPFIIKPTSINFSSVLTPINACGDKFKGALSTLCSGIRALFETGEKHEIFTAVKNLMDVDDITEQYRKYIFGKYYDTSPEGYILLRNIDNGDTTHPSPLVKDATIHLSYLPSEQHYVNVFKSLLCWSQPETTFTFETLSDGYQQEKAAITTMVFLSANYLSSKRQTEELLLLLAQLRKESDWRRLYVVVVSRLPFKPLYSHLIPTQTHLLDELWEEALPGRCSQGAEHEKCIQLRENMTGKGLGRLTDPELLGIRKATVDVRAIVNGHSLPGFSEDNDVIIDVMKYHRRMSGTDIEETYVSGPKVETSMHDNSDTSKGVSTSKHDNADTSNIKSFNHPSSKATSGNSQACTVL